MHPGSSGRMRSREQLTYLSFHRVLGAKIFDVIQDEKKSSFSEKSSYFKIKAYKDNNVFAHFMLVRKLTAASTFDKTGTPALRSNNPILSNEMNVQKNRLRAAGVIKLKDECAVPHSISLFPSTITTNAFFYSNSK